jgi:hypothetical protein
MNSILKIVNIIKKGDGDIDNMSYGMFNNKGFFGYSSKVLKSGICKYYRRELFDKFEWCSIEMMLFGIKSNCLVSNICNRLNILVMEEISCNDENLLESINMLNSIHIEQDLMIKIKKVKLFCDIVRNCKRGRICSYVNNWWKFNSITYDSDTLPNNVLKYKKSGDSDELLVLGERMIYYIENGDNKLFDIYQKLYDFGKSGRRYRRVDGIYLYWEIIEDYLCTDKNKKIVFQFALNMFNRKSMKERRSFGIWIGLMVLNRNDLNYKTNIVKEDIDIETYLLNRVKIDINEDFVVNDWHVNKKYSKKKFGEVGSYVENEDTSLLGNNFTTYKQFYIVKKGEEDSLDKIKEKKDKKDNDEVIDFHKIFKVIKIINEGVCGMKKPCVIVEYLIDNEKYVLKEMSVTGMNSGIDYMFMDSLKKEFGLVDLEMKRIKSNVGFVLVDKSIKKYRDNCILEEKSKHVYFCMMKFIENSGDLSNSKELLKNETIMEDMLKIRLYDGLFRSSDNNMRNILVGVNNKLISIDEGDIFGKRVNLFDKNDWVKKSKWCRDNIDRIIDKFIYKDNDNTRCEVIKNRMIEYKFSIEKISEFEKRYTEFRDIVKSELLL